MSSPSVQLVGCEEASRRSASLQGEGNGVKLGSGGPSLAGRHKKTRGENPCRSTDKPRSGSADPDIRFLDQEELEAVLGVEHEHDFDSMLKVRYLTAAMSGLRLGECCGLRWRDVDWVAGRIRVRQSYVRGEIGPPKSKRSSRSVPLADRIAGKLERLFQRSNYQADDALVFRQPAVWKADQR